jgi:hypothetical protein
VGDVHREPRNRARRRYRACLLSTVYCLLSVSVSVSVSAVALYIPCNMHTDSLIYSMRQPSPLSMAASLACWANPAHTLSTPQCA